MIFMELETASAATVSRTMTGCAFETGIVLQEMVL